MGCHQALLEGEFLCSACWDQLEPISTVCCQVCSSPLVTSFVPTCSNCYERQLHFVAAIGAFHYKTLLQELLSRYKYGHDESLKPLLQQLILRALQEERLRKMEFTAVVPVPLHFLRERERGFNQAVPLAQAIAYYKNLPMKMLLKRTVQTSFQAAANRQKRLENLEHAFTLKVPGSLQGNYLLVDDVLTTGTTLNECAKVLLEAGADQVWGVTLAR